MRTLPWRDDVATNYLTGLEQVSKSHAAASSTTAVTPGVKQFSRFAIPTPRTGKHEPASWVVDRDEYVKHFKGTVYMVISSIAKKVAMQEAKVYIVRHKKSGEKEEPAPHDHPLVELFEFVNPLHTQFDLWWQMVAWRLLTGDSFWWKARNGLGVPAELWAIPSQWAWAVPSSHRFIEEYVIRAGFFGDEARIRPEDIVHIREPGVDFSGNGKFYGTPFLATAAEAIDIEEAIFKRLFHTIKNFVPPGLHYQTDDDLSEEQVGDLYAQLIYQRSQAETAGGPIISHSGLKVSEFNGRQRDLDYTKGLQTVMDFILAMGGTPKAAVGLSKDYNRANFQGAILAWSEIVINPLLVHTGQHLTRSFRPEYDDPIVVRFNPVTVDDAAVIRSNVESAHKMGAITPNEARDLLLRKGPWKHGGNMPMLTGQPTEAPFGDEQPKPPEPPPKVDPVTGVVQTEKVEADELFKVDDDGRVTSSAPGVVERFFRQ